MVWFRVLGLRPQLWTLEVLKSMGDKLGTFIEVDKSFLERKRKTMACILVSLNPSKGFLDELNISFIGYTCCQNLDYKGFPFNCCHFHKTRNLLRDFQIPYMGKFKS